MRAPVPVISVGNLTAGGTGKTPLVIHLARALLDRGARPAVLARGYGAARDGEPNDELLLAREEVPGLLLFPGRDRSARIAEAVGAGATLILLDDGFQHRRVARDFDLVLIDASDPWGPGGLLPRGLLREPRTALRRADLVLITRAEQVGADALAAIEAEVRAVGYAGPVGRIHVHPRDLLPIDRPGYPEPVESLRGARVLAACAIGNPEAFRATLLGLGARVQELVTFPDHAPLGPAEVAAVEAQARRADADRIVVTAKDAVKLRPHLAGERPIRWLSLRIDVRPEPADVLASVLTLPGRSAPPGEATHG